MNFEDEGLFLGLVSYPFYIDGGNIFNNIFKGFFQTQHREEYLEKLTPDLDPALYNPVAYRMFGNHGLAILALIDDYAFCSRIFNSGHIKIDDGAQRDNMYKCIALTGFSESFLDSKKYLRERANQTFLLPNEEKRYPFIGIIRIKLEYSHLQGKGSLLTTYIKRRIETLKENVVKTIKAERPDATAIHLQSIVVDAHDNDEMFAVAFSNSIHTLDTYLKEIRRISISDLGLFEQGEDAPTRHVCASCHMSYGYHIDFSFKHPEDGGFLKWDQENDRIPDSHESAYLVNCLIETKPGHRQDFCDYLNTQAVSFSQKYFYFSKTVTGGSIVHVRIPLEEVETLHNLAADRSSEFRRHIRRIKLTLSDNRQRYKELSEEEQPQAKETERRNTNCEGETIVNLLDNEFIRNVKNALTDLGISKIVRERLLSLLDLFNDCGRNKLHLSYFRQLKPAVENIYKILTDFLKGDESLLKIEKVLNDEISALETAFYNRMHNKMTPNTVLEYGGGIQQFLQAFGFAYREVVRVLSPEEAPNNYTMVTGVSKESSQRTHTELNINHIIYPQLFCVTTWKEASNFTLRLLDGDRVLNKQDNDPTIVETKREFEIFRKFIKNQDAFEEVLNLMISQTDLMRSDPVYRLLKTILSRDMIKYSVHDYLVYHFAFRRDFELMWRYYFKIFLQTPSVYHRRGVINKKAFLFELLRLMLVAYRENNPLRKQRIGAFLETQRILPFDNTLSAVWFESFEKIQSVAKNICNNLQSYGYTAMSDFVIIHSEYQIVRKKNKLENIPLHLWDGYDIIKHEPSRTNDLLDLFLANRDRFVTSLAAHIENGSFDDSVFNGFLKNPECTIDLMNAFLIVIDNLDRKGKSRIETYTVPRDFKNGEIDYDVLQEILPLSSNILADPTGGYIIPNHAIRKEYFSYRTLLYRTLWNLSYRTLAD